MNHYTKRKTIKHKTHWTVSDLNRYQDQKNYRMNEAEYFANPSPSFENFDLDKALEFIPIYQDIQGDNKFKRALAWFKDVPFFERGSKRSHLQA